MLTPPDIIAPSFGPGSRARHVAAVQMVLITMADAVVLVAVFGYVVRPHGGPAGDAGQRRDACHHPDGTVRLVCGALRGLADEIGMHLSGRYSAEETA